MHDRFLSPIGGDNNSKWKKEKRKKKIGEVFGILIIFFSILI